jgi:folate-binding protein YgfZ
VTGTGPPATDGGYGALHDGLAARVVGRDVLAVSGPDAAGYLQGQCSQDLDALAVGGSADSLLLSPQGKIDAVVRVTRTGDETFVLDTEDGSGPTARARLERFRLRTKVAFEPLGWACLSVRGPRAPAGAPDGRSAGGPELVIPVVWPGWVGVDLLGPWPVGDPDLEGWLPEGAVRCDEDAWDAARIEVGVPVWGREVTSSSIAAEVGLVDRTVSFTKGCYTGQELVARLDARGSNVARRLCGVVVAGDVRPPVGASVWTVDGEHEVGGLSSVAWSPGLGATVALATLHRRVTPPEAVVVEWDGSGPVHRVDAEARPLPLVPGA